MHARLHVCMRAYVYVCTGVCMYACMHERVNACMSANVSVCMHVCVHVCVNGGCSLTALRLDPHCCSLMSLQISIAWSSDKCHLETGQFVEH